MKKKSEEDNLTIQVSSLRGYPRDQESIKKEKKVNGKIHPELMRVCFNESGNDKCSIFKRGKEKIEAYSAANLDLKCIPENLMSILDEKVKEKKSEDDILVLNFRYIKSQDKFEFVDWHTVETPEELGEFSSSDSRSDTSSDSSDSFDTEHAKKVVSEKVSELESYLKQNHENLGDKGIQNILNTQRESWLKRLRDGKDLD